MDYDETKLMTLTYLANIFVAGTVGFISLFFNTHANKFILSEKKATTTNSSYLVGSFWIAITILSVFGLFRPYKFSAVFVVQFIYKGLFLIIRFIPGYLKGEFRNDNIINMSIFFFVWVIWLPCIIPWGYLFYN
jgi:hypothetical protein